MPARPVRGAGTGRLSGGLLRREAEAFARVTSKMQCSEQRLIDSCDGVRDDRSAARVNPQSMVALEAAMSCLPETVSSIRRTVLGLAGREVGSLGRPEAALSVAEIRLRSYEGGPQEGFAKSIGH